VHIGLPSDISEIEIDIFQTTPDVTENNTFQNDIQKIIALLKNSQRPLIAAGLTAARLDIGNELLAFLDNYKIPVVLTPMAKGLLSEDHTCYAGVLFHSLSDYLEDLYLKTDLIIGIGYDPVEYNYESWIPEVPLINFDIRRTDLPEGNDIVQYAGPVEEWFELLKNLNRGSLIFEKAVIQGIRDEMQSVFDGFTNHFGPAAALKILQNELPEKVFLTADVGSHLHLLGQFWQTHGRRNLIMTNGWSGMGFGIPASLAVQLNNPDATVVCITGDGGFLMMAGEIITARRYGLPVVVVVFSDGELNLIKIKQSWKNIPPYGTLLYQGDLFGTDLFFGVRVLRADSHESMSRAVIEALALREPVIINAVIDPEDYKWLIVRR
jgi:acetolactate synthase-1/2/3 large subunit